jgi:hypothetical protein
MAERLSCPPHFGAFARDTWRELKGFPFRDDPFTEADWSRHVTWRRYIPEPHVSGVVILSLAPVWGWSVIVSMCVGLYATYAQVGLTRAGARCRCGCWFATKGCVCLLSAGTCPEVFHTATLPCSHEAGLT